MCLIGVKVHRKIVSFIFEKNLAIAISFNAISFDVPRSTP